MLAERGLLAGELPPVFPFNVVKYARGCLHAARGDHETARSPTCSRSGPTPAAGAS